MTEDEINRRFDFHPSRCEKTWQDHKIARAQFKRLAQELNAGLPDGREKQEAFSRLEEAHFWAHAAIARGCCLCAQVPQPADPC